MQSDPNPPHCPVSNPNYEDASLHKYHTGALFYFLSPNLLRHLSNKPVQQNLCASMFGSLYSISECQLVNLVSDLFPRFPSIAGSLLQIVAFSFCRASLLQANGCPNIKRMLTLMSKISNVCSYIDLT